MKCIWKRSLAAMLLVAMTAVFGTGVLAAAPPAISYSRIASLEVYVDGALSSDLSQNNVVCGEVVKLTAPAVGGKTFSHWAFDSSAGTVASTRNPWQFALQSNTKVYAVYGTEADKTKPSVAFSSIIKEERMGRGYIRMTAAYSLPSTVSDPVPSASNPVLGEVGIRYTTNRMLGVGDKTRDLISNPVDGFDVTALLKSDKAGKSVHFSSDKFYYAMGDWTVGLGDPGEGVHVYAVAYVTWDGQSIFSDVKSIVYGSLEEGSVLSANVSDPFSFPTDD